MRMKSYLSPKAKVKRSKIHKFGLFAIKLIKKGEIVGIKSGHIIDKKTFEKLGGFENIEVGYSALQIADNFFLVALKKQEYKDITMFVNHSCNPNVGIFGNVISVAMRDIRSGEELTGDYAMWMNYPSYKMICSCNKKNCRKIITGEDWKQSKLQKKYKGFFSMYIQKKINKFK